MMILGEYETSVCFAVFICRDAFLSLGWMKDAARRHVGRSRSVENNTPAEAVAHRGFVNETLTTPPPWLGLYPVYMPVISWQAIRGGQSQLVFS